MPSRRERLFEEIEVQREYGNSDLLTDCIRIGRRTDGIIKIYFWGDGEPCAVVLSHEASGQLWEQLEEATQMCIDPEPEEE